MLAPHRQVSPPPPQVKSGGGLSSQASCAGLPAGAQART